MLRQMGSTAMTRGSQTSGKMWFHSDFMWATHKALVLVSWPRLSSW